MKLSIEEESSRERVYFKLWFNESNRLASANFFSKVMFALKGTIPILVCDWVTDVGKENIKKLAKDTATYQSYKRYDLWLKNIFIYQLASLNVKTQNYYLTFC